MIKRLTNEKNHLAKTIETMSLLCFIMKRITTILQRIIINYNFQPKVLFALMIHLIIANKILGNAG